MKVSQLRGARTVEGKYKKDTKSLRINDKERAMTETHTWPELAIGLYDKLTGRGAEISYHFDNLEVWVPASTEADAAQARWKVSGKVVISTRDTK